MAVTGGAQVRAGAAGRPVTGPEGPRRRTATRAAPAGDGGPVTGAPRDAVPTAPAPPTSVADLLTGAAELLPAVVGRPPVLACDVQTALTEAAARAAAGAGRPDQLRSASYALDHFLTFLRATGRVPAAPRVSQALRRWTAGRDLPAVQRALTTAAAHWRDREGIR